MSQAPLDPPSRTHAAALALVNWRGVFYARYLLDRHVTALEGANGAGKTTVMIAAYVVLLPDMSRLRFTNLGETGATGGDKGIYGRLGEPGRPTYAAIDFQLPDGQRLIAGVHLERRGEPTVEPTPFVVTGLAADVRLQDLLLHTVGQEEVVPELDELRAAATRLGGRLQVFPTAREYFATLFEAGVTPLRLGGDEERSKFNEMLRTSMTGGISRALTSELRAFLLKEDGSLAGTLTRMRTNLEACRRTRLEVQEARRLEAEISGVQEAGQAMFGAAYAAARARAEELGVRVEAARRRQVEAAEQRAAQADAAESEARQLQAVDARRQHVAQAVEQARAAVERSQRALEVAGRLTTRTTELAHRTAEAQEAAHQRQRAEARRSEARLARDRVRAHAHEASLGLADQQRGLDALHRRAAEHRQATAALIQAREVLQQPDLQTDFAHAAVLATTRLSQVDAERRQLTRRLADVETLHREHAEAAAALATLAPSAPPQAAAARAALQHQATLIRRVEQAPHVARALAEARQLAQRQTRARAQAEAAGVVLDGPPGAEVVGAALAAAQATRTAADEEAQAAREAAREAERTALALDERAEGLTARATRWSEVQGLLATLAAHGASPRTRGELDALRGELASRLAARRSASAEHKDRREGVLRAARELSSAAGAFHPDLLRARDAVEGELLALHFEETRLEDAALLEARLGPLTHAIVVADPAEAARRLAGRPRDVGTLWLVAEDAALAGLPEDVLGAGALRDVVVPEGDATRLTRVPGVATLGRRARAHQAEVLRAEAEALGQTLDELGTEIRETKALLETTERLLASVDAWEAGDPAPLLVAARTARVDADQARTRHLQRARVATERSAQVGPQVAALQALLADAWLLDPPDHGAEATALVAEAAAAEAAAHELRRTESARAVLERLADALRHPPPTPAEVAAMGHQLTQLDAERDRLAVAVEALGRLAAAPEALAWGAAEADLTQHRAVVPALEAQHAAATAALARAEAEVATAEAEHEGAVDRDQRASAVRQGVEEACHRARGELADLAVEDPSAEGVAAVRAERTRLEAEAARLETEARALAAESGRRAERQRQVEQEAAAAEAARLREEQAAQPATLLWEELQQKANELGILPRGDGVIPGDSAALQSLADQGQVRLFERLRSARGGPELLAALENADEAAPAGARLPAHAGALAIWMHVRDWLRRRVPAQVAEAAEPLVALERLRDHLAGLEERLGRQETELRGESEDVGRGIDVQIRQARYQVTRLNRSLEGVRFGSIQALRVHMQRSERMEQVLAALREGEAQELLFQASLPIEEALEEIFRRYGGGRTGGQRLLDYREYIELTVEVRRQTGGTWEVANPTRLSTGEAIGVGAALMMVVLTEWERDAHLLRGRRQAGSLRFLFLDEANRLSHDNLGVLFELCRNLDLQLLIAAPEVARAEGNTTYRLIRRVDAAGREEVVVSGRRIEASGLATPPPAELESTADAGNSTP